ncbi:DUF4286 family protein [Variovorax sp. E3]|uniref:DUF4286 family protein n=1 Tax=Variovorax sp. E3 TaxID=1914993 RepID=UPI0018DB8421|nr:DUF4286 family protein [Variovorax sp. E3]
MQDLWLLKRDASAAPDESFMAELRQRSAQVRHWQAVDGGASYLYLPGDVSPVDTLPCSGSGRHRLDCMQEIAGASHGLAASFHYVVETDVLPEFEQDFNAWYAQEHLPGLAAVKGTVRAARYVVASGSPRYYACYDLESPDALDSPAWLAVRATAWSSRVRPAFRNTRRTMFFKR